MKAVIERQWAASEYKVMVAQRGGKVSAFLRGKLEWVSVPNDERLPDDLGITVSQEMASEMAQAIHIAAIEAGLLPNSERLEGELEATKKHLIDLQKAFNALLSLEQLR